MIVNTSKNMKKIVIYDGQLDENTPEFEKYIATLQNRLDDEGYNVSCYKLRNMKLAFCLGCFNCWLKTPGLCVAKDDGDILRKAWIDADLVIFASPLETGFSSSLIKTMVDKFLPLILPFIQIKDKEMQHYHRYDHFSPLACIFAPDKKDTIEDLQINYNWIERVAYHTGEAMVFATTPQEDINNILQSASTFFNTEKQPIKPMQWPEPLINPNLSASDNSNQLLIINGSLRVKSNTGILAEYIKAGFESTPGKTAKIIKLNNIDKRTKAIEEFEKADLVLFALPLYVHAMPAHVKLFIEELDSAIKMTGKRIAFLIQSGFNESHQSRWLEPYFSRLSERWGAVYAGIAIRGAVEGIQVQPASMTKKLFKSMENIGVELGQNGALSTNLVNSISKMEHLSATFRFLFKIMQKVGLVDWFWNKQLKENGAYNNRYAKPLENIDNK